MVDALDLGSSAARCAGSSPATRISIRSIVLSVPVVESKSIKFRGTDLSVTVTDRNSESMSCSVKITGESLKGLPEVSWQHFHDQVMRDSRKTYSGFRKIPRDLLVQEFKRRFGDGVSMDTYIAQDFAKISVGTVVENVAGKEAEFYLTRDLTYDFQAAEPHISYSLDIDLAPAVPQIDLETLGLKKYTVEVSGEDARKELEEYAKNFPRPIECPPKPAADGDILQIDLRLSGPGGISEDQTDVLLCLGSNVLVPEFHKKCIGLKAGDRVSHDFVVPKSIDDPSISGKSMMLVVKIKKVFERGAYELDEEFAKAIGYATLEEAIAARLADMRKRAQSVLLETVLERAKIALGKTDIFLPKRKLDHEVQNSSLQVSDAQLKQLNQTRESFEERVRRMLSSTMKTELMLRKFIEDHKIEVTASDIEDAEKEYIERITLENPNNQFNLVKYDTNVIREAVTKDSRLRTALSVGAMQKKIAEKMVASLSSDPISISVQELFQIKEQLTKDFQREMFPEFAQAMDDLNANIEALSADIAEKQNAKNDVAEVSQKKSDIEQPAKKSHAKKHEEATDKQASEHKRHAKETIESGSGAEQSVAKKSRAKKNIAQDKSGADPQEAK